MEELKDEGCCEDEGSCALERAAGAVGLRRRRRRAFGEGLGWEVSLRFEEVASWVRRRRGRRGGRWVAGEEGRELVLKSWRTRRVDA